MSYSPYLKCVACKRIVHDPLMKLIALAEPCPDCGDTGNCRQGWPSLFGDIWRDTLQRHSGSSETDRYALTVMLCAAAEHFQRQLCRAILFHQSPGSPHAIILLDAFEGKDKQATLFKNLTQVPLQKACEDRGYGPFCQSWRSLATTRNHFVHGTPPTPGLKCSPSDTDLETVRTGMLEVFSRLENDFAAPPRSAAGGIDL